MKASSIVFLAVLLVLSPAFAAAPKKAPPKTDDVRLDVNLENAPLSAAIDLLSQATGANFAIDPAVFEKKSDTDYNVTLKLKKAKAGSVLKLLMQVYGLAVTTADDIVVITVPEKAVVAEQPMLVVYEVFDMSELKHHPSYFGNVRNFSAYNVTDYPRFHRWDYDPQWEHYKSWRAEQRPLIEPKALMELIMASVPAAWEGGGRSIAYANGLLIVNQPATVQLEIAKLLYRLRLRQ